MVEPVFGRWGPTEVMERVLDGTWAEVVDGMGLIEPVSIAFSGTSAAITALGSVEFSAVSSLSLNGVFSSDFDNYMVACWHTSGSSGNGFYFRYRAFSTDNSTANSYVDQQLAAYSTTVQGQRTTSNQGRFTSVSNSQRFGLTAFIYGPYLTQPTAFRTVSVTGSGGGEVIDYAGTHNQSTSYDGITLYPGDSTFTGRVAVYGMVK